MANEPVLKINPNAIARIAKSAEAQQITKSAADRVAAAVRSEVEAARGDPDQVRVDEYVTDRRVAAVVAPADLQATDGVLSRGSNAAGVHVTT
ncbi:hypothetical protein SEA_GRANDSLAM_15 [Gordonia phage GrandSlam]|nr:hypothetical protein SEA_CHOP_15 [Gordonia phage Chop]UXL91290.1 hypothetical protein SEA_GRANDSLAM_15 [Gordonia phage GrandSlam]